MIIFDFNQVAISSLMEQIGSSKKPVEESLVRHMILNVIRTYVKKFKATHGPEVVIACDNKHYWRRDIFPQYKASRKKNRDASGHDWASIFDCLHKIKEELKENSPYKVVDVDTCEADDIIAVLSTKYAAVRKLRRIEKIKCEAWKYGLALTFMIYFVWLVWAVVQVRIDHSPELGRCLLPKGTWPYEHYNNLKWIDCEIKGEPKSPS